MCSPSERGYAIEYTPHGHSVDYDVNEWAFETAHIAACNPECGDCGNCVVGWITVALQLRYYL